MAVVVMPNIEAMVSAHLRGHTDVAALVDDRVYTAIPANAVYPLVRVTQFTDAPTVQRPLWHIAADLQVEAFGGTKAQARLIAETCRAALAHDLPGTRPEGVVTGVDTQGMSDQPDESFAPAKPRWLFVVTVYAHP